jgi:hypothetical protein
MLAGRPHEAVGNGSPRWMTAAPRKRAHRTRPTGRLTHPCAVELSVCGHGWAAFGRCRLSSLRPGAASRVRRPARFSGRSPQAGPSVPRGLPRRESHLSLRGRSRAGRQPASGQSASPAGRSSHPGARPRTASYARTTPGLLRRVPGRSPDGPGVPYADPGDLPGPVPVDREQHRAEHRAVIPVELVAERSDELLGRALRVLIAPSGDGGAGPVQVFGAVVSEPHGRRPASRPRSTLDFAARFMADASLTIAYQRGDTSSPVAVSRAIVTTRSAQEYPGVRGLPDATTATRRYAR